MMGLTRQRRRVVGVVLLLVAGLVILWRDASVLKAVTNKSSITVGNDSWKFWNRMATPTWSSRTASNSATPTALGSEVCSLLSQLAGGGEVHADRLIPSTLSLWTRYLDTIHKASQLLPHDIDYEMHDLTAQLLHLISPRLPNSIKALPRRDWKSVQYILDHVFLPRWRYVTNTSGNNNNNPAPRPVKMVVLGGSVVEGINCNQYAQKWIRHSLTRTQCAWPYRLQQLLDHLLGDSVFEVHTMTMGGSNSRTGTAILEFDLMPTRPDIILHAYATNDMHLATFQQGEDYYQGGRNRPWRDVIFHVVQDFIRMAFQTQPCPLEDTSPPPPLVVHLDDYLGNEQREILATTELSQAVQVLAQYYGNFGAISYADMIRDWVYGDTQEFWFSPRGWYLSYKKNANKMVREIHPGMPMHTTIPWVIAYFGLHLTTTYCSVERYQHDAEVQQQLTHNTEQTSTAETDPRARLLDHEYERSRMRQGLRLPALKGNIRLPGKPRSPPHHGLPPRLTSQLSLEDVSNLWRNETTKSFEEASQRQCSDASIEPKCPLAWVSGLLGEHNRWDESSVEKYFSDNSLQFDNRGWELKRHVDGKKMGWVPVGEQPGASLTLVYVNAQQPRKLIRQIVLFYLKSYGDRWENSRLRVQIDRQSLSSATTDAVPPLGLNWELVLERELVGFHAKNTSEMYIERMKFAEPITTGKDVVRFRANFVSGKAFKIMGLLICS